MGSLAFLSITERPLALDIQSFANRMVRLDISDSRCVLAYVDAQSPLLDRICSRQFEDEDLVALRDRVLGGRASLAPAIHPVFHVSMLRRYVPDESHVLQYDAVELDDRLTFVEEPVAILARDVRRLHSRAIPIVKVRWRHRPVEEATWETEHEMRGKLSPRYIGSFEILRTVGEVAYELALPPAFSAIHPVFHVSMLRRYVPDESHVLQYDAVELDDRLTFVEEPVAILARDVRRLHSRAIPIVKVRWRHRPVEEATWETEHEMRGKLSPRYIGSFEILRTVGEVAYELALPPAFSAIHPVFHVSMLRRYVPNESHVLQYDAVELDDRLTFVEEPVAILARDVRRLHSRAIPIVKGKLSPRYIGSFEILRTVGEVAYELALPPDFSAIHPVFHVSMLRRYVPDESHVLQYDAVELDDRLTFVEEPVAILPRDVMRLHSRAIPIVKVRWRHRPVEEATWETEHEMRGKHSPRYIGSFEILRTVGEVAYELALPQAFSAIHPVFHVSMLRRYVPDESHVLQYDAVELDDRLTFVEEPVAILARDVRRLHSRAIPIVKVRWRHRPVEEATWETEHEMRVQSPDLFEHSGTS
ncbi:hypothetical protein MTR67_012008 [Solanum verrucosum]|uniref:Tf2-1-like SH3-like domain-containing protein n=1 Tax=Solanum verrucosum TaxID=315347 RepID=A0AAF0TJW0_SOLVR|nr:hypothetical protein MTR67_012008 [Solanum verrucosum]